MEVCNLYGAYVEAQFNKSDIFEVSTFQIGSTEFYYHL